MAGGSTSRGFVDLQVNGYAGVDFNQDHLSAEKLRFACEQLREDGVAGILATVVTAELPQMLARLERIADVCRSDPLVRGVIWGIHIEGPFLNESPGYAGAHPPAAMRPADVEVMKRLLAAADGLTRLVTLAPERDAGCQVTRWLAGQKILVSAGHCDPTLDQLRAAADAGLSMFTHLGNGCPMMLHRHDNIIQRALSMRERLTLCFIADGTHVPPVALANYLSLAGTDRTILVTDAISAARLGPGATRSAASRSPSATISWPGRPTAPTSLAQPPPCRAWPRCSASNWACRPVKSKTSSAAIRAKCSAGRVFLHQ